MTSLVLDGVSRRFGPVTALDEFSLAIPSGRLLVVLGASGSGKSTLLRVIAGLERPDGGRVVLADRDVTDVAPAHRDVAMVFQDLALFPHLSARDNIAFGLRARRVDAGEVARRVGEVATRFGLSDALERRPRELSGGERQRVALARALVRRPGVLLLDEPLSSVDAPLRAELRDEIRALHGEYGTTIVHVTHDQAEALALGETLAVVDAGRLRQLAAPAEAYDRPADTFVARFLGSPPMNVVAGEVREGRVLALGGDLGPAQPDDPAGPVLVGFRPEHVRAGGDEAAPVATVTGVESAGHDVVHRLDVGGERIAARLGSSVAEGDRIPLAIEPAALRLFVKDSGKAL